MSNDPKRPQNDASFLDALNDDLLSDFLDGAFGESTPEPAPEAAPAEAASQEATPQEAAPVPFGAAPSFGASAAPVPFAAAPSPLPEATPNFSPHLLAPGSDIESTLLSDLEETQPPDDLDATFIAEAPSVVPVFPPPAPTAPPSPAGLRLPLPASLSSKPEIAIPKHEPTPPYGSHPRTPAAPEVRRVASFVEQQDEPTETLRFPMAPATPTPAVPFAAFSPASSTLPDAPAATTTPDAPAALLPSEPEIVRPPRSSLMAKPGAAPSSPELPSAPMLSTAVPPPPTPPRPPTPAAPRVPPGPPPQSAEKPLSGAAAALARLRAKETTAPKGPPGLRLPTPVPGAQRVTTPTPAPELPTVPAPSAPAEAESAFAAESPAAAPEPGPAPLSRGDAAPPVPFGAPPSASPTPAAIAPVLSPTPSGMSPGAPPAPSAFSGGTLPPPPIPAPSERSAQFSAVPVAGPPPAPPLSAESKPLSPRQPTPAPGAPPRTSPLMPPPPPRTGPASERSAQFSTSLFAPPPPRTSAASERSAQFSTAQLTTPPAPPGTTPPPIPAPSERSAQFSAVPVAGPPPAPPLSAESKPLSPRQPTPAPGSVLSSGIAPSQPGLSAEETDELLDIFQDAPSRQKPAAPAPARPPAFSTKAKTAWDGDSLPPDGDESEELASAAPGAPETAREAAQRDIELLESELIIETDAKQRGALSFEVGRLYEEGLDDLPAARAWYDKALLVDPLHRLAARSLRACAERGEDFSTAARAVKREIAATSAPPELPSLWLDLAGLWQRQGERDEARAALVKAQELAPADLRVLWESAEAARAEARWDDFAQAARLLAQTPEAGPLRAALSWDLVFAEMQRGAHEGAALAISTLAEFAPHEAGEFAARLAMQRQNAPGAAQIDLGDPARRALAGLRAAPRGAAPSPEAAAQESGLLPALLRVAASGRGYQALSAHLMTERARGVVQSFASFYQEADATPPPAALREESAWTLALLPSEGTEAADALLSYFPGAAATLRERYAADELGALQWWQERLYQDDPAPRHHARRLAARVGGESEIVAALCEAPHLLSAEERTLYAAERADISALSLVSEENQGVLRALISAQEPEETRRGALIDAAEAITDPGLRAVLLSAAGQDFARAGESARARELLRNSLALRPGFVPSIAAALRLAAKAGDLGEYLALRETELESISPVDRQEAAALCYEIGVLHEATGHPEQALEFHNNTLDLWPGHLPATLALVDLTALHRDPMAHADLLIALAESSSVSAETSSSSFLLAAEVCLWALNRPDIAEEALGRVRALLPNEPVAWRLAEFSAWRAGDPAALVRLYEQTLPDAGNDLRRELSLRLGRLSLDPEISLRWYQEARAASEYEDPLILLLLARQLQALRQWEPLADIYGQLAENAGPLRPAALLNQLAALQLAKSPEALQRVALRLFEELPWAGLPRRLVLNAGPLSLESLLLLMRANEPRGRGLLLVRRAEEQLAEGEIDAARVSFQSARQDAPGLLSSLRGELLLAELSGDVRAQAETLAQLGEVLSDPREASSVLLQAAERFATAYPDGAAARRALWRALEREPQNLEAFTKLRAALSPDSREDTLALRQALERRLSFATGEERRALLFEYATLCRERLGEPQAARLALRELASAENAPYRMLAELAILEQTAHEHAAAADLFVRILRHPETTQAQRRDAYWALGDIYEQHIPDQGRAIASYRHVVALGGLSEQEAALRLARLLARDPEHKTEAAELLVRVANADPDPGGRSRFLLRSLSFWESTGDLAQAISSGQRALNLDARDLEAIEALARLYRLKKDDRARHIHLGRAALAFRVLLRENAADLNAYQALIRVYQLAEEPARAALAARLYALFGGNDPALLAVAREATPRAPLAADKFQDRALREKLQHPDALPSLRALLSLLADVLRRLYPSDLLRYSVGASDRITAGTTVQSLAALARPFGLSGLALYNQRLKSNLFALDQASPPALVLGASLQALARPETDFLIGRALYLAAHGPLYAATLGTPELTDVLCGVSLALNAQTELQKTKTPRAEEIARLAAPALARHNTATTIPLLLESLPSGAFPGEAFARGLQHEANRAALLLVGDPAHALSALAALHDSRLPRPGEPVPDTFARAPQVIELVQFILGDGYAELR